MPTHNFPHWLNALAWISLVLGLVSAAVVGLNVARHRQRMWIMNVVWPITALYAGPLGLWAYFRFGRMSAQDSRRADNDETHKPFWQVAATGTTHCGSGCALGDMISEWFVFFVPLTLFGRHIYATWVLDYIAAFALGIGFQYFTIKPMRQLSVRSGLLAAVKADAASLSAWQIGMYGWMAFATFLVFGRELPKTSAVFWFMMQLAMLTGFLTSYPVNWWLIRHGVKEAM